jgi:hypothetical protein
MGLLLKLLALPVTGPAEALVWVAEKLSEQADKELYDEDKVRSQLMELEFRYDLGEVNEEEYMQSEQELLDRLKVVRERKAAQEQA